MERIKESTPVSGLGKPLNYSADPVHMSRAKKSPKKGNGNSLPPNTATYGLGLGTAPNMMKRTGGSGKSGSTFKLTHAGPGRAGKAPKSGISHDAPDYGVGGVSGDVSTRGYGVGGVGK